MSLEELLKTTGAEVKKGKKVLTYRNSIKEWEVSKNLYSLKDYRLLYAGPDLSKAIEAFLKE